MPKVSVIMPMYNAASFLEESVSSILGQSLKDIELIIINDCSNDNSKEIVSSINDPRIILLDNTHNIGAYKSLNKGIEIAQGEYIANMDADDIACQDRLERQVEYMNSHKNAVLCVTDTRLLVDGMIRSSREVFVKTPQQRRFYLAFDNCFSTHSSFLMRRDTLKANNIFYDEEYVYAGDYRLQTVLSEYGDIGYVDEPLVIYRVHSKQASSTRPSRLIYGEGDRIKIQYLNSLHIDRIRKPLLQGIIERKLDTRVAVEEFVKAFYDFALYCGMDMDNSEDIRCMQFIYKYVMCTQWKNPKLLYSFFSPNSCRISKMILKPYFILECLFSRNNHNIRSDYSVLDDGTVIRHL